MESVTHIPHQHIQSIYPRLVNLGEPGVMIETINPLNGAKDNYVSTRRITIDDKGIYGSFVKI